MNKVVTINLAGRAYQLEEAAHNALSSYLDEARDKLAADPDRDEIMADLELAVAQKCEQHLTKSKNVVTTADAKAIIEAMGPVEPANDDADTDSPPKRLYLIKEGSMIAGVCNGLAAYLNIDVTVIRVLFVALTFLTSGGWILAYFIMMVAVPQAKTPEELAAAHGEKFSAQELVDRAKQKTAPALSGLGKGITKLTRVIAGVITAGLAVGFLWLTMTCLGAVWWIAFGHLHLYDQLSTVSVWAVAGAIGALYLLVALPLIDLLIIFKRLTTGQGYNAKRTIYWQAAFIAAWMVAASVLLAIVVVNYDRIRDFQQTHAYFQVNQEHKLCVNGELCNPDEHNGAKPLPPYPQLPYRPSIGD
jgi:phage shock protein PspC (stress-responsive transcriptional regulator)